jgi:hypothetical protein
VARDLREGPSRSASLFPVRTVVTEKRDAGGPKSGTLDCAAFPDTSRLQLLTLIRVVESRTVLAVLDDAVEVSRVPNPNESRWRHVATRSRLSLPRLPVGIGPRRSVERHDGRPAAGRQQVADEAEAPDQGSQRLMRPTGPHSHLLTITAKRGGIGAGTSRGAPSRPCCCGLRGESLRRKTGEGVGPPCRYNATP